MESFLDTGSWFCNIHVCISHVLLFMVLNFMRGSLIKLFLLLAIVFDLFFWDPLSFCDKRGENVLITLIGGSNYFD
jgi:hypothetical protein